MKVLLAIFAFATSSAFAASQNEAAYQCDQYRLELKGPNRTALFDAKNNLVGEWNEEGADPTFMVDSTLFVVAKNHLYQCKLIEGGK